MDIETLLLDCFELRPEHLSGRLPIVLRDPISHPSLEHRLLCGFFERSRSSSWAVRWPCCARMLMG